MYFALHQCPSGTTVNWLIVVCYILAVVNSDGCLVCSCFSRLSENYVPLPDIGSLYISLVQYSSGRLFFIHLN